MKGTGRIVSCAFNRKNISIRIVLDVESAKFIDELNAYKGKTKTLRLDTLQIVGKIESITLCKSVGFLVHVARLDFISRRLFGVMEKDSLSVEVSTTQQDKLLYFLDTVAKRRNEKAADLLFDLSSFRKKDENGERTIPGKRSVFELSESQLNVVFDKISHLAAISP